MAPSGAGSQPELEPGNIFLPAELSGGDFVQPQEFQKLVLKKFGGPRFFIKLL